MIQSEIVLGPSAEEFRALQSIVATSESMARAKPATVALLDAKAFAAADIKSFNAIADPGSRDIALLAIHKSVLSQIQYQVALSQQDQKLWIAAHAAGKKAEPMAAPINPINSMEAAVETIRAAQASAGETVAPHPKATQEPMVEKGLALLTEAHELRERLASIQAQWSSHIDEQFPPTIQANNAVNPMDDANVAAYYEVASKTAVAPAPDGSLEDNHNACLVIPREEMDAGHAKSMARDDIASLAVISDPQARNDALLTIHANGRNQPQYEAEMNQQAPALALEARTAFEANRQTRNAPTIEGAPSASQAATQPAAGRYKSAGIQRSLAANDATAKPVARISTPAPTPTAAPVTQQPKLKEKEEAVPPKPKKIKEEENPYAKGREQNSTARKLGKMVKHMAFGLTGGLAVGALYKRIFRKKTLKENAAAEQKKAQKAQQKIAKKAPIEKKPAEQKTAQITPVQQKPVLKPVVQKVAVPQQAAQRPVEQKAQKGRGMRH